MKKLLLTLFALTFILSTSAQEMQLAASITLDEAYILVGEDYTIELNYQQPQTMTYWIDWGDNNPIRYTDSFGEWPWSNIIQSNTIKGMNIKVYAENPENINHLDCSKAKELDLSPLSKLIQLYCHDGSLEEINLKNHPLLQRLSCSYNKIKELRLEFCPELTSLNCFKNEISSLDFSQCPKIQDISCDFNKLSELSLRNLTQLNSLYCSNNSIQSLNLVNCTNLQTLDCSYNMIYSLDLTSCNSIMSLNCSNNNLQNLDVRELYNLSNINCDNNEITTLAFGNHLYLSIVDCASNNISELNFENIPRLSSLHCNGNNLTTLNLRYCSGLFTLQCSSNNLSVLDLQNCTDLSYLDCSQNSIQNLNLNNEKKLININCSNNLLENLNLSNYNQLYSLNCQENRLETLVLDGCTALQTLFCNGNNHSSFSKLDLSNLIALENLDCSYNNNLSQLIIENCPQLNTITCNNCRLAFNELPKKSDLPLLHHFDYAPQSWSGGNMQVSTGEAVDLSSSGATSYNWIDSNRTSLVEGLDFTITNGVSTFLRAIDYEIFCEMTHEDYPDLILSYMIHKVIDSGQSINEAEMMGVKVVGGKNQITITTENAIKYSVYTTTGNIIFAQVEALAGETTIPIPQAGVYVVKVMQNGNSATQKVLVK